MVSERYISFLVEEDIEVLRSSQQGLDHEQDLLTHTHTFFEVKPAGHMNTSSAFKAYKIKSSIDMFLRMIAFQCTALSSGFAFCYLCCDRREVEPLSGVEVASPRLRRKVSRSPLRWSRRCPLAQLFVTRSERRCSCLPLPPGVDPHSHDRFHCPDHSPDM